MRFSPIENKNQLMKAIEYTHTECFKLCKKALGKYLPVAGNIGIFCHYDKEYIFLTKIREELTDINDNWNNKYFRLHKPIIYGDGVIFTHLYIRHPDKDKSQVGDVDLVIDKKSFAKLKDLSNNKINGVELSYRPTLDMIRLSSPDIDTLVYLTTTSMSEKEWSYPS